MKLSRRGFLASLGAGGALSIQPRMGAAKDTQRSNKSAIQHIVLVMMENRSFDHFLGWMKNADGRQTGLVYQDSLGVSHSTYPLAPDYQGCGHPDPDHSYSGGRVEYDDGRCDGWLRAGENDIYSIGYYTQADLPFLGQAAPAWTTCARYFAATMASTYPNRIYQHAAQTDRDADTTTISTLPTIWDRLAAAGISGRYYFSDVPVLALWGAKYISISRFIADFFADCAAGTLPSVSFVDPRFLDEESGTSGDDHPHADIRNGEVFLNLIYEAVTASPNWANTVLIINFDEWGGFFEHVPPHPAPDNNPAMALRGFRVPCIVISPYARRSYISHTTFDHTSVLKLIEWRWDLKPLTLRDASANNLATALDLESFNPDIPEFSVPVGLFGAPCPSSAAAALAVDSEASALLELARATGWRV
ncbi:MAG TPA: alkaline phosphatase family protein [Bryobacteraceae bacterium]|jgi:phospholipase C|nr:alkaline phosphatase family protein [Bryobacteraceae bacterium]